MEAARAGEAQGRRIEMRPARHAGRAHLDAPPPSADQRTTGVSSFAGRAFSASWNSEKVWFT